MEGFEVIDDSKLRPVFKFDYNDKRTFPLGEIINWEKTYDDIKAGFCFFLSRAEAARAYRDILKTWCQSSFVLLPIYYEEGIGTHTETGIAHGKSYEIALCKRFRIGLNLRKSPNKIKMPAIINKEESK